MADNEQDNVERPFHREGEAVVFDKLKSQEEIARETREREQHEFARAQVKTNKLLAWFTGALMVATFCTIGIGIWQATISQRAANAAKSAADTAASSLKDSQTSAAQNLSLMVQQTAAQQRAAKAQENAAEASLIAANTAEKQRLLMVQQMEQTERQISANLVFENFKVEGATVSFDVVNAGNSVATKIGFGEASGDFRDVVTTGSTQTVVPDISGFSLDKGQARHFEQEASTEWRNFHNGGHYWAWWIKLSYVTIFQKTDSACAIVIAHKYMPRLSDCSFVPELKQKQ